MPKWQYGLSAIVQPWVLPNAVSKASAVNQMLGVR